MVADRLVSQPAIDYPFDTVAAIQPGEPGQTQKAKEQGERRRQAILDAATVVIGEKGSHASSLAEIAAAAGVTRSGLLHHYPSKDRLIEAVFIEHERAVEPFFEQLAEAGGLAGIEGLVGLAAGQVENPAGVAFWSMIAAENSAPGPSSPLRQRLLDAYDGYWSAVVDLLEEADRKGELRPGVDKRAEAVEIIGLIEGLSANWLLDPDSVDLVAAVDRYLKRKVDDLRGRRSD